MESLLCEIEGFSDIVTSEKKAKIRNIQCLCYGFPLHVVSGTVKNVVDISGGRNINILCLGYKSSLLRTIFCPSSVSSDFSGLSEFLAVPVISFDSAGLRWYYEFFPDQNKSTAFDFSKQPFMVYLKDFSMRSWSPGVQEIPVSFKPYRSERTGKTGMQYIARDDVSPSVISSGSVQSPKKSVLGLRKD
ncbi:MAG: hypothetical protein AB7S75_13335 [Desulfococcaceae bacterium]